MTGQSSGAARHPSARRTFNPPSPALISSPSWSFLLRGMSLPVLCLATELAFILTPRIPNVSRGSSYAKTQSFPAPVFICCLIYPANWQFLKNLSLPGQAAPLSSSHLPLPQILPASALPVIRVKLPFAQASVRRLISVLPLRLSRLPAGRSSKACPCPYSGSQLPSLR